MAKKEVRIVVTKNQSGNKTELAAYEPANGKLTTFGNAGPNRKMVEADVRRMKDQLERAGNQVSVIER